MVIFCHFEGGALKRKIPETVYVSGICFVSRLLLSGTTWNRTRDTRIFSPLLYHLSYGTIKSIKETLIMWYHLESNQGHTDFQSVALPSELWYLCKTRCKYKENFLSSKCTLNFYYCISFPLPAYLPRSEGN